MPKREDEYFAGSGGVKRPPQCPFCGSLDVYPIKEKRLYFFNRTVGWSCANERCRMYRKLFPSPSRGPGRMRPRR
jgi:hypothetical protein